MNRHALAVPLLLYAVLAFAAPVPLGKYTLEAGEKTMVTVEAKTDTTIGFTNLGGVDEAKKCRKTCIRMNVPDDLFQDAAAAIGTSMKISPKNGKIEVQFQNLEAFPIAIEVFRE
jgi:hypothetical protein